MCEERCACDRCVREEARVCGGCGCEEGVWGGSAREAARACAGGLARVSREDWEGAVPAEEPAGRRMHTSGEGTSEKRRLGSGE